MNFHIRFLFFYYKNTTFATYLKGVNNQTIKMASFICKSEVFAVKFIH